MMLRTQGGGLGAATASVPETSLPWYQQFWDELISPFQTDQRVLAEQTATVVTNYWPSILIIGGAIWLFARRR